ncbi:MAG: class I SAM-dependent methyltransferase [Planctomycetota bacterium]|nr:class I SAM-dependent methyltransferase [Planctomycetota bacterium]
MSEGPEARLLELVGECGVRFAGFTSPQRALFRCAETFESVPLAGKRVLEVGAGTGLFSAYAAAMGASRVVALEPECEGSTKGFKSAIRQVHAAMGAAHFEVRGERLQDYRADGKFDVVLIYNAINHLDEPSCIELRRSAAAVQAYREIFTHVARMMESPGLLVLADCSCRNAFALLHLRNPVASSIEWHKHQTPLTWANLLAPLGFTRQKLTWYKYYPLRTFGCLFANAGVSFFLSSHFRMILRYEGPASP